MPIYGYKCQSCGHTLDALQKMSEDPLVGCPACGASALKRQLSAPRFRLKGQGWYETDFKKDNQRNLAGDSSTSSSSESSSGASSKSSGESSGTSSSSTSSDSTTSKASTSTS
ncbi:MAG: zinc ribbon domain-containing protein [Pseudomonadota bacterium]